MDFKTVGIVGLGLMGGSLAKTIKKHTECKVLGFDLNKDSLALAEISNSIDGVLTEEKIKECDLLILSIYPESILDWVDTYASFLKKDAVLMDLCGIKREIYNPLSIAAEKNSFHYIGGHPMAGKEVQGFYHACDNLYDGASMILTPKKSTAIELVEYVMDFYLSLGFREVIFSSPENHDKIIAYTSQLAHVVSSAYIKSPTSRKRMGFTAGSYKDMTRVARLNPEMWTQLFMDNSDYLASELREIIGNLEDYLEAIENGDRERLFSLLEQGRNLKITEPLDK